MCCYIFIFWNRSSSISKSFQHEDRGGGTTWSYLSSDQRCHIFNAPEDWSHWTEFGHGEDLRSHRHGYRLNVPFIFYFEFCFLCTYEYCNFCIDKLYQSQSILPLSHDLKCCRVAGFRIATETNSFVHRLHTDHRRRLQPQETHYAT